MMNKIQVRVKPSSGKQEIESFGDNRFLVYLESPAENNEANIELIRLMARHLGIPSTKLKIISGLSGRDKTLEVVY